MAKSAFIGVTIVLIIIICILTYYFGNFIGKLSDTGDFMDEKVLFKNQPSYEIKNVRNELKKYNMIKRIKDDQGNNKGIVEPKINFSKTEKVSFYQNFVTPNHPAVINYINNNQINDYVDSYNKAVSWVWMSDQTLHNREEKWIKPKEFILNSATLPNNPLGVMASDCESQAYTLVSIIEATGFSKEKVRVCIGKVNFSGTSSGHAWVEIYQNNKWIELEATSGPYYDDDTEKLVNSAGISIDYFENNPYPVEEYWAFFNDVYFYNPDNGVSSTNLPYYWK